MAIQKTAFAAALLGLGLAGLGQVPPATQPTPPTARQSPIALALWPQALEKPDLQYQLLPRMEDTQKGNAAVLYLAADRGIVRKENDWITMDTLRYTPLKDLDEKLATEYLRQYQGAFELMHKGARLDRIDWESNIRTDGINATFSGLSMMRGLQSALWIDIRVDIKQHRWAQAQDKLQTGYSMARQMAHGETIVEGLVASVMTVAMNHCVEEWVSEPGAPNLYWPLTNLPAPMVDLRPALAMERSLWFISFPELKQMRDGPVTRETWIRFVADFFNKNPAQTPADAKTKVQNEFVATAFAAAEYPRSKQFLVERGMKAEEVEKMPVAEVVGRAFERSFEESTDELFKWYGLPPMQAAAGVAKVSEESAKQPSNLGNMLARTAGPSFGNTITNITMPDRQIAMLRTVEALRAYAAAKGAFPDALSDLTLPLPLDPLTGKPFAYDVDGNKASVIAPPPAGSPNPRNGYRYDLTLQK